MPDTDRLINKDQGDSIIAAIQGITSRLQEMYTVDDALSSTSENPVQNKVVKAALDDKVDKVTGKGLSTNDYTNDNKALVATIPDKADSADVAGTQTATGNPLTLTDAAPINAESLVVELEPKQDGSGDPSPTNIRPITGYTECEVESVGTNFANNSLLSNISAYTPNGDGYLKTPLAIPTGDFSAKFYGVITTGYAKIVNRTQSTEYFLVLNGVIQDAVSFHVNDGDLVELHVAGNDQTGVDNYFGNANLMINKGNAILPYEPYQSSNATIQFGQTVYGGSVDFKTGVLTVTHKCVDMGDLVWNKQTSVGSDVAVSPSLFSEIAVYEHDDINFKCSEYRPSDLYDWHVNGNITIGNVFAQKYVNVCNSDFVNKTNEEIQTMLQGVQLWYELATPFTIQLTPDDLKLHKGTNNITTNGTTIQIGYQRDNVVGELKGEIQEIKEMPYLRILDNDVDTEIKNYRLYYRSISSAYTLVNLAEILQHRFLFVEVIQNPSGTSNDKLLHSALIDPRTIDGFEYQIKAGTGDTVCIKTNIAENKLDLYVQSTGTHTSGDPTDYYVTIRMVD